MKKCMLLFLLCSLCACRPVRATKQYYDEHINPVASIDYSAQVSTTLPSEFLDNYYSVDSRLVRLVNQIDLSDGKISDEWMATRKSEAPWIRALAVLDSDLLFLTGDDALGYDPLARNAATALGAGQMKKAMYLEAGRAFLLCALATDPEHSRTVMVEIDLQALQEGVASDGLCLAIDGQILHQSPEAYARTVGELASSKKYSGSARDDGRTIYWIRSMATDNLVYLYSK